MQPLLAIRYVVPMLAMVPLAALSGVHWSLTLALVLAWAFMASLGESGSFFFNLKQAIFGHGWTSFLVATPIFFWLVFAAPGWLASAALPLWFYFKATGWLANQNVREDAAGRAKKLFGQAQHLTRTGFATQTYLEDQMHVQARQEQANDCARNPEPLMDINATSTGYFTSTGSLNSPDEGKNMVETPPHTWGRRTTTLRIIMLLGNTPTYVGKTSTTNRANRPGWKHPHIRGEDLNTTQRTIFPLETPSHTWGRPCHGCQVMTSIGNTPTYVGKTWLEWPAWRPRGKHPHIRGEDALDSALCRLR